MSKLLTEYNILSFDKNLLNEEYEKTGKLILSGVFQRADSPNQNKRIYPYEILKAQADKFMKVIAEDRALGEADHPESIIVNLANVSHIIRDLWWQGKDLMGKLEILPTTKGNDVKGMVLSGVKLGVSSRGVGSVKESIFPKDSSRVSIVEPDYELITFDLVSQPSTEGAFLLKESKELSTKDLKYIELDRLMSQTLLGK
jgi:hypothetical protein